MELENLPEVHAARHAERSENDVDRATVLAMYGMSSSGKMREMTPLLPWRPASLSPTETVRSCATSTYDFLDDAALELIALLARKYFARR